VIKSQRHVGEKSCQGKLVIAGFMCGATDVTPVYHPFKDFAAFLDHYEYLLEYALIFTVSWLH